MAEEGTLAMNLTITDFKLWNNHPFKNYLAIRKKSVECSHQDLAAWAFACYKNNVTVDINTEQNYRRQLQEYPEKLKTDGFKISYPLSIISGWIGEEQGIINWSAIYFHDTGKYLTPTNAHILLIDCTLNINREEKHIFACEFFKRYFIAKFSVL